MKFSLDRSLFFCYISSYFFPFLRKKERHSWVGSESGIRRQLSDRKASFLWASLARRGAGRQGVVSMRSETVPELGGWGLSSAGGSGWAGRWGAWGLRALGSGKRRIKSLRLSPELGGFFLEPLASWSTPLRLPKALVLSKEQVKRKKISPGSSVPAD